MIGFILSEVKGIIGKTPNDVDISKEGIIVAQNLMNFSVSDMINPLKEPDRKISSLHSVI